ncbi:CAAX prenyl protease 2 [Ziziphus jujuba]|uniref:intramembrane prenyl-peptidase Rce1 n=1 Tax=Ziziphus jujuba TaxID=326968 RepID=A0A6P4AT78_ZIZJJ|nr:CAAX prenyl protease 2 [Ziziphus jujuba]
MEEEGVSKPLAVVVCAAMAVFYVAILYAPTLILRLSPPSSSNDFLIRRFLCAVVSSVVSIIICALILPVRSSEASYLFGVYGIRADHIWQAVVFPLSLTSLMYAGSLVLKSLLLIDSWSDYVNSSGGFSFGCIKTVLQSVLEWGLSAASNILAWRTFVVAPLTEELVFRACMIPLLLCGGFKTTTIIFLCPIFFSLAHLNHLAEVYSRENFNLIKAIMVIGVQLGYTVIFGSYASFLFVRTGHLLAPLVAHIFCNFMGLPVLFSSRKGIVSLAFIVGVLGFLWLLFPMTRPELYNNRTNNCRCWHGYCSWS